MYISKQSKEDRRKSEEKGIFHKVAFSSGIYIVNLHSGDLAITQKVLKL
jgi:hypothetical protein